MEIIKLYAFTLVLLCSANQYLGLFKAHFPSSDGGKYPRLVIGRIPELREFTFCSWIRLLNSSTRPHIFSYGRNATDKDIAVFMNRTTSGCMDNSLQVKNNIAKYNCCFVDWSVTSWHHVCTSWFGGDGNTTYYVDGQQCSVRDYRKLSRTIVPGGGVGILGQGRQKPDNTGFDEQESWSGDIVGVNLWREVLSENQIKEAGRCGDKKKLGTVIAWSKTPMAAYDGIVISEAEVCEP